MAFDIRLDNGRILLGDDGNVEIVSGTDKLMQDILREVTTSLGDDIFNPERGSTLNKDLVGVPLDPDVLLPRMQASILRSLEAFREQQQLQAARQFFSDAELLLEIDNVSTELDTVDPRQINVRIDVTSRALTPLTITFTWLAF